LFSTVADKAAEAVNAVDSCADVIIMSRVKALTETANKAKETLDTARDVQEHLTELLKINTATMLKSSDAVDNNLIALCESTTAVKQSSVALSLSENAV
jgi:hypothetical protein